MARTENGGGDILARGGVRATFKQPKVSKRVYNKATQGFDLAAYLAKDEQKTQTGTKELSRRGR
jgi:hypothetical protein